MMKKLIENEMNSLTRELNTLTKSGKLNSSKKAEITNQAKNLERRTLLPIIVIRIKFI